MENFDRNEAQEIDFEWTLSELPSILKQAAVENKNVYVELPTGRKFYALDYKFSILAEIQDEICREMFGKSAAEVSEIKAKLAAEQERINNKFDSKNKLISDLQNQARPLIYQEKWPAWGRKVGDYYGSSNLKTLVDSLAVMQVLDSGDMSLAQSTLNQLASTEEKAKEIEKIVALFAKNGPEFYEFVNQNNLSQGQKIELELLKVRNSELAKNEQSHEQM